MKIFLLFLSLFIAPFFIQVNAQIADFPFNSNLIDVVNGYSPTTVGNPTIISDGGIQVLQLEGDEALSLPDALHQSIDPAQDVEIQIRFKITDTYANVPFAGNGLFGEEGKRILISNKLNEIVERGFDIYVAELDDEYRMLMSFGDDTGSGGTFIFNDKIEVNEWVDLKLILRLNNEIPSIVYKINEYYQHFPLNYLNVDVFKESLNTQQIWVGTDAENDQQFFDYAYAETFVDYVKIFNPPFVGNTTVVASSLLALTNHLNGNAPLSQLQQKTHLGLITTNWDDNTYFAITADVLNYISTFENEEGTVYSFYGEYIEPKEVEAPRSLQFMLIQWMIDNLYTSANATNMEGISFLDHQIMPGTVDQSAPRIMGTVLVDGTYNTNPGYFLNTSEFVIRPTGFYAAPGELVNITVPASLVNQGVKIHVGAHFVDIREDYRGFQRFPTIATKFNVNNTTMTVANPLGGAIYITFPDGSNFGGVMLDIDNAVKSPYFSTKAGFTNSLTQYQADLNNAYVNWVDIESDNFMCTFPKALAILAPNVDDVLAPFNTMIGQFNVIAGRPLTKIRSEYVISEPQTYTQGTYPASYPMSIPNGDIEESDPEGIPISVLNPQGFMASYDGSTILHELGHLHSLPTMFAEGETNVNVPAVMAFEVAFGAPIDTGSYYANHFQKLDGDKSALDWILDSKFRSFQSMEYLESSYQCRGTAKYVDVARLFSWDTLGLIHNYWYQQQLNSGEAAVGIENVSPDEYIEAASNQLNINMAPLFEIWGTVPSNSMIAQLSSFNTDNRIRNRILYYRSLVPRNASEFIVTANTIIPNIEEHHQVRYNNMLNTYDESMADSILFRIDDILCKYYNINCGSTNTSICSDSDNDQVCDPDDLCPGGNDGIDLNNNETPDECEFSAVALKILLEGPFNQTTGEMGTMLADNNLIPLTQPFNNLVYNYSGSETLSSVSNNMVDWILVEARTGPNPTDKIQSIAGILLSNGDIKSSDGVSDLNFSLPAGSNVHFVIRHRNHLDIMTANSIPRAATILYDFTTSSNQAFGTEQLKVVAGKALMFAGDITQDHIIQATDFDAWSVNPALINVYSLADLNMDGIVQVTDYDQWFVNKAKLTPSEIGY